MSKLLVSDYDKTLKVNYDFNCDFLMRINVKAIKKFIHDGNYFMLNTGRAFESIKKEIVDNNIPYSYLACNDGTLLLDNKDNIVRVFDINNPIYNYEYALKYLDMRGFNPTLIDNSIVISKDYYNAVQNIADELYLNYNIVDDNVVLSPLSLDDTIKVLIKKYPDFMCKEWKHDDILLEYEIRRNNQKIMFSLKNDQSGIVDEIKRIALLYNIQLSIFIERFIYLRHLDITKSTMIEEARNLLKLSHDNIYTVGDNYNDYHMIKDYHGYTMPWGKKELKDVCEGITPSVSSLIKKIRKW